MRGKARLSWPIALDPAVDNRPHPVKVYPERTMIDALDQFMRFQTEALKLRSQRQELLAANVANADTPNYKAVDFDFGKALQAATANASGPAPAPEVLYREPAQASLDGNSVEMDAERAQFADNSVRYEAALRFLNAPLKTMLAALQG
jgi:flagellar basal-body rod protein FlgB